LPNLNSFFPGKHIDSAVNHYRKLVEHLELGEWERSILAGGKFIEATLKSLMTLAKLPIPPARQFKVSKAVNQLNNLPAGSIHDSFRLTIPRAAEFAYDVASNRGARHDPDEIDPNKMDAAATTEVCSWILGELLRVANRGVHDLDRINEIVSGLSERRFLAIETVENRTYFHIKGASAREIGLLLLWKAYPKRLSKEALEAGIARHHFKPRNASLAIARLNRVVDRDKAGDFRLLRPGLIEADAVLRRRD
jgi:hypothetical protein